MKIEHFAFNVEAPLAMAEWYTEHLGLKVKKQKKSPPYMTFMADESEKVMIEIYHNPVDKVPDYRNMNPLIVHLAFVSKDPSNDKKRLMKVGAEFVSEDQFEDGSHLLMLRDPWGFALQFCKRKVPMLSMQGV